MLSPPAKSVKSIPLPAGSQPLPSPPPLTEHATEAPAMHVETLDLTALHPRGKQRHAARKRARQEESPRLHIPRSAVEAAVAAMPVEETAWPVPQTASAEDEELQKAIALSLRGAAASPTSAEVSDIYEHSQRLPQPAQRSEPVTVEDDDDDDVAIVPINTPGKHVSHALTVPETNLTAPSPSALPLLRGTSGSSQTHPIADSKQPTLDRFFSPPDASTTTRVNRVKKTVLLEEEPIPEPPSRIERMMRAAKEREEQERVAATTSTATATAASSTFDGVEPPSRMERLRRWMETEKNDSAAAATTTTTASSRSAVSEADSDLAKAIEASKV